MKAPVLYRGTFLNPPELFPSLLWPWWARWSPMRSWYMSWNREKFWNDQLRQVENYFTWGDPPKSYWESK